MNSNIVYDEKNDNLYILIYKLGTGACATVWFSIEFNKFMQNIKQKNIIVSHKALKIHNSEDYDEGIIETKIIDIIPKSDPDSQYINYPLSHFIIDEDIVVVVYEVAIGSLYDILKMYDKKLPLTFIDKIIPQMIKSIELIHKNGFVHTDIKPENFLLVGTTKFQSDILNFVKKYDLYSKLQLNKKKVITNKNMIEILHEPVYNLLTKLSENFELKGNIVEEESEEEEEEDEEEEEEDEEDEEETLKSNKSNDYDLIYQDMNDIEEDDDNSSTSTYGSHRGEFFLKFDKFNIKRIKYLESNELSDNKSIESENNMINEKLEFIQKYLDNPKIVLMDFGLMKSPSELCRTVQTRYYRSPEILFGLKYDKSIDLWALGCSLYELITGEIMINVEKSEYNEKYDKDLIHIKFLIERIETQGYKNIMYLANLSPRKSYLFNDDNTLKFFKDITYQNWKNVDRFCGVNKRTIDLIENLLQIVPSNRKISI